MLILLLPCFIFGANQIAHFRHQFTFLHKLFQANDIFVWWVQSMLLLNIVLHSWDRPTSCSDQIRAMRCAAMCSAAMIAVTFGVEGISGKIDASITRRASTPCTVPRQHQEDRSTPRRYRPPSPTRRVFLLAVGSDVRHIFRPSRHTRGAALPLTVGHLEQSYWQTSRIGFASFLGWAWK